EAEETFLRSQPYQSPTASGGAQQGTASAFSHPLGEAPPPNTSVLRRRRADQQVADPDRPPRTYPLARGENIQASVTRILRSQGGEPVQVQQMLAAMRRVLPDAQVPTPLQLQLTMVPSVTRPGEEPARFSLVTDSGDHKVSVTRNAAGEFEASPTPF